MLVSPY